MIPNLQLIQWEIDTKFTTNNEYLMQNLQPIQWIFDTKFTTNTIDIYYQI